MTKRRASKKDFVQWTEDTVRLPIGLAAEPGPIVLPAYMREIAQSMTDPTVERLSIIKAARVGYSTLVSALIGWHMTVDPAPVLVVVPAELDARNFVVATEDIFECSPNLQGKLPTPTSAGRSSRNTLLFRRGENGASLRLVGATAPRNLRAVGAKILICDEADGLKPTPEGDAISLAERRTLAYPDRRLIVGSTPLDAETSHVVRLYRESDSRIYEICCPSCGGLSSLEWEAIEWPAGQPELAMWRCPQCRELIPESHKAAAVERGAWRPQRPEVTRHRGYLVPTTLSSLANVSWGKLATEFENVKADPGRLKVFYCTSLARPWEEQGETVDGSALSSRAEPFSLDTIPTEVILITCGIDCQDDRLEVVICGWSRTGECYVLAYETIFGAINDNLLWQQVSELLAMAWPHPAGGRLRVDSMCVDGGDGGHLEIVLGFCTPRSSRRVRAIKGVAGFSRKLIEPSKSKMHGGGRLWVCGVDAAKSLIFARLQRGNQIRFSNSLHGTFYEHLSSERIVMRTVGGKPTKRFERVRGAVAHALDALVYATCAHAGLRLNQAIIERRESLLGITTPIPPSTPPAPPAVLPEEPEPPEPDTPPAPERPAGMKEVGLKSPGSAWTAGATHSKFAPKPQSWATGGRRPEGWVGVGGRGDRWHDRW
jgi:phage terminase large subunit GpA-like protein